MDHGAGLLITGSASLRAKSERGLIWLVMRWAGVKLVGQSSLTPTTNRLLIDYLVLTDRHFATDGDMLQAWLYDSALSLQTR